MARAYAEAAKSVIEVAKFIPYQKEIQIFFESDYKNIRKIEYQLKLLGIERVEKNFEAKNILWNLWVSENKIGTLKNSLNNLVKEFKT
jgi:putative IMPACT (imprinted ancient) family translation regulator